MAKHYRCYGIDTLVLDPEWLGAERRTDALGTGRGGVGLAADSADGANLATIHVARTCRGWSHVHRCSVRFCQVTLPPAVTAMISDLRLESVGTCASSQCQKTTTNRETVNHTLPTSGRAGVGTASPNRLPYHRQSLANAKSWQSTQNSRQSDQFWSGTSSNLRALFRSGLPNIGGATVARAGAIPVEATQLTGHNACAAERGSLRQSARVHCSLAERAGAHGCIARWLRGQGRIQVG